MVVSETQEAAESFSETFGQSDFEIVSLHFQGDFQSVARDKDVRGVFLAMNEVGERGLASIIKIQSAIGESKPLIAAGPQWTRKTVLQAVKYGARDILMTPATTDEVMAKVAVHMQGRR